MVEPTLTMLEAFHRLALNEGQKENISEKGRKMRKVEWSRKTISVVLLAAVLPISLTVAFLFGGGIRIAETTTLDSIVWTFQRPNQTVPRQYDVSCELNATYVSEGILATPSVLVGSYVEHDEAMGDFVTLGLEVNATTNLNSYIESVNVVVQKDKESKLDWGETGLQFENLSLADLADGYSWRTQAYIELAGVNRTSSVHASAVAEWSLLTPNTQPHQMEISFEVTYYNGSAYNRMVQPFQLNILGAEE